MILRRFLSQAAAAASANAAAPQTFLVTRMRCNPFVTPLIAWKQELSDLRPIAFLSLQRRIFGAEGRPDLIHRVDRWYRAGIRAGTACTKTRAEVRGSNAKGRPQKGSGRARIGCKRAPHLRKGGVSHGPKPRSFEHSLNKKVRRCAMRVALSAKYESNSILFVPDDSFLARPGEEPENAMLRLYDTAKKHGWIGKNVLFLDAVFEPAPVTLLIGYLQQLELDRFAGLSLPPNYKERRVSYMNVVFDAHSEFKKKRGPGRNIPFRLRELNAYHILRNRVVVVTERALKHLEEVLAV